MRQLSHQETRALTLFSAGRDYEYVRHQLGISKASIHMVAYHLRWKTGIKDTQDATECKAFMEKRRIAAMEPKPIPVPMLPSPTMLRCMEMYAIQDKTYEQIRLELGLVSRQTVMNHISLGCKRAKIRVHPSLRRTHTRMWLQEHPELLLFPTMSDPMF